MPARRLILVVMLIGSIGAACGQGTTSITHTVGGAAAGTPAAVSSSPTSRATPPNAAATPACTLTPSSAAQSSSPTAAVGSAVPTADASGQYRQLTLAQAQRLAPFHLAQPAWAPPCLQVAEITAFASNITEVQPNPPMPEVPTPIPTVMATVPTGTVQVVRLSFRDPVPNDFTVVINELKQGTPLGPVSGQDTPGNQAATLTIAGHSVTRITWAVVAVAPAPGPNAVYVWTDQGTTFQLAAYVGPFPADEQGIEHMIASMLQ